MMEHKAVKLTAQLFILRTDSLQQRVIRRAVVLFAKVAEFMQDNVINIFRREVNYIAVEHNAVALRTAAPTAAHTAEGYGQSAAYADSRSGFKAVLQAGGEDICRGLF